MLAETILFTGFLMLRANGAILRSRRRALCVRGAGWLLCAMGAWLATGAVGAWSPLWPVVVAAFLGWILTTRYDGTVLRTGIDLSVVVLVGARSTPPCAIGVLAGISAFVGCVGFILDRGAGWAEQMQHQHGRLALRWGARASLSLLVVIGAWEGTKLGSRHPVDRVWNDLWTVPQLAVSADVRPRRVDLPGGSVAWLERPSFGNPTRVAVFFHGNNPKGSRQKAAFVLRRALLDAGLVVLSVDHPGYGESPNPRNRQDVDAWNPLPAGLAAVEAARRLSGCEELIVVGHSLGCGDVFRVLGNSREPVAGIIFGAGLPDGSDRDDYWYARFHRDRRLSESLPPELVKDIRRRYYNTATLVEALPDDHAPVHFVRFGIENGNIVETRDRLFALIHGHKQAWDLPGVGHYFNSQDIEGIVVGDSRSSRSCAHMLKAIMQELSSSAIATVSDNKPASPLHGPVPGMRHL